MSLVREETPSSPQLGKYICKHSRGASIGLGLQVDIAWDTDELKAQRKTLLVGNGNGLTRFPWFIAPILVLIRTCSVSLFMRPSQAVLSDSGTLKHPKESQLNGGPDENSLLKLSMFRVDTPVPIAFSPSPGDAGKGEGLDNGEGDEIGSSSDLSPEMDSRWGEEFRSVLSETVSVAQLHRPDDVTLSSVLLVLVAATTVVSSSTRSTLPPASLFANPSRFPALCPIQETVMKWPEVKTTTAVTCEARRPAEAQLCANFGAISVNEGPFVEVKKKESRLRLNPHSFRMDVVEPQRKSRKKIQEILREVDATQELVDLHPDAVKWDQPRIERSSMKEKYVSVSWHNGDRSSIFSSCGQSFTLLEIGLREGQSGDVEFKSSSPFSSDVMSFADRMALLMTRGGEHDALSEEELEGAIRGRPTHTVTLLIEKQTNSLESFLKKWSARCKVPAKN
ncbi:hypothetical protein BLNAU_8131 [Blattamonas nauphoetae]|uniref:Uncharacterized protein n=1 Tax=Blattamonas nauphoetae TaxID=2049346 RepID=A0ABQ9XZG9_9EUKA|nr:hypothetical protein BLNAU_8131 [Blattamonas nauphoetae]